MKRKPLLMALTALLFMLTACGNNQTETNQNNNQTANTAEDAVAEDTAALEKNTDQIAAVRNAWALKPLTVAAADGTTDLERCAVAFCKEYSIFTPNKVLYDYFKSPTQFEKDEETLGFEYYIMNQKDEGFILCRAGVQCSWDTECSCWKRDNGHSLVAFWMADYYEDGSGDDLLVFYDYDPETGIMTPDLESNKKIESTTSQYNGGYYVRLDDRAISCTLLDEEDEYLDSHYYLIRWDGNDISLEKEEE